VPDLFPDARHCAGGQIKIAVRPGVIGQAIFGGPGDCYRYLLERRLATPVTGRTVMFLWMNPSTAEHHVDDPTVAKGWRYALSWGFDRMLVGNVDAYRCTDQRRLVEVADPQGPDNLGHLIAMARQAVTVVVGYGTPRVPQVRAHGPLVARALLEAGIALHVLRLSKEGVPVHPLYLPGDLRPVPWSGP
jgi:hypothetical protein